MRKFGREYNLGSNADAPSILATAWAVVLYHMTGSAQVAFQVEGGRPRQKQGPKSRVVGLDIDPAWPSDEISKQLYTHLTASCVFQIGIGHAREDKAKVDSKIILSSREKTSLISAENDITLDFWVSGCGSKVTTNLFCRKRVGPRPRIWSQLLDRVLTLMLQNPSIRIFEADVSASFQLHLARPYPGSRRHGDTRIHDLVSRTAARLGSRVAICSWDGNMTYRELDETSNLWSRALRQSGFGRGTPVIHCIDASKWAVVAWLSIIKAGFVCVPQDTRTPMSRLEVIIASTSAKILLCDEHRESRYSGVVDDVRSWWTLNEAAHKLHGDDVQCDQEPSGEDTAIIVYTSGSTGVPKGVQKVHSAIARGLLLSTEALGINEQTRLLQFSSLSFDLSVTEIFMPLAVGGCVCIPNPLQKLSLLNENMAQLGVTDAILTPTVASHISLDKVPSLQTLSLGGEAPSLQLCRKLMARLKLHNIYGSTEGTVWDSVASISPSTLNLKNIGHPIGARLWLTHPDNWHHLSPIGVPGEVCVQGPDISRGYLNMPEMTNDRYKNGPKWLPDWTDCGLAASRTLYRTGDLGRLMPDGTIELMGRRDRQMKINGQRFELNEVEACLKKHVPQGSHVHVNMHKMENGRQLVAYVSAGSASSLSEELAREWLRAAATELLDFMVPKTIVPLQRFPLTHTGKIDAQKLAEIGQEFVRSRRSGNASQARPVEIDSIAGLMRREICTYLTDVKEISPESLGDNFSLADVSIDSLDAPALADRIKQATGRDVPSSTFLKMNIKVSDIGSLVEQGSLCCKSMEPEEMARELDHWKTALEQQMTDPEPLPATNMADVLDADFLDESRGRLVFLTGATGFVGLEMVRQLLEHSSRIRVVALVRHDNDQAALQRIMEAGRRGSWWKDVYAQRLRVWLGDLSKERLGLGSKQWEAVFSGFDHVVHNGAHVNWALDYPSLRAVNVGSTFQLLSGLVRPGSTPKFMFVSGGYLDPSGTSVLELVGKVDGLSGYDETKLVCEALVHHLNHQIVPDACLATVLKPGFVVGSTRDGVTREKDAIWRLVKACVDVGFHSDVDADKWISVAGVDQVCKLVVDFVLAPGHERGPEFQKIVNGMRLKDVWAAVARAGFVVRPLEHQQWIKVMADEMDARGVAHALYPLREWLRSSGGCLGGEEPLEGQSVDGICPLVAVERSLEYLASSGWISRPVCGVGDQ